MAAAGAALSIVGTVFGVIGGLGQAKAAQKAEDARQQQMHLEALRRRRESIRQGAVARASAISSATNQGAGESSALQGGIAQVQTATGRNVLAANQDKEAGDQVFAANKAYARAGSMIAIGNGISSLGGAVSSSSGSMQKLGFMGA